MWASRQHSGVSIGQGRYDTNAKLSDNQSGASSVAQPIGQGRHETNAKVSDNPCGLSSVALVVPEGGALFRSVASGGACFGIGHLLNAVVTIVAGGGLLTDMGLPNVWVSACAP